MLTRMPLCVEIGKKSMSRVRMNPWIPTIMCMVFAVAPLSEILAQSANAPNAAARRCVKGYQPPVPMVSQQRWVMDDYPESAMRNEEEGDVGVAITVGLDGRAVDVEVTQRAASQALNDAAVKAIMRRARFYPAMQNCKPVVGEFETYIRWRLR